MYDVKNQAETHHSIDSKIGGMEVVFIVDRSGSMKGSEEDTIGGYNAMLEKQRGGEGKAFITTILFDDRYEVLHDGAEISNVESISGKDYFVRGRTALLDAVGRTIGKIDDRLKAVSDCGVDVCIIKPIVVIITDGLENASREFSRTDVKNLIRDKQVMGWEFIYLGADIESFRDADSIGIRDDRRYCYGKERQREVYESMSENISLYRGGKDFPDDWKDRLNAEIKGLDKQAKKQRCISIDRAAGRFILDTGSPISFGMVPEVEIGGTIYPLAEGGLIILELRKHLGGDIAGIIGMDILGKQDICLLYDQANERIKFNFGGFPEFEPETGVEIEVNTILGIPTITVLLAGRARRLFLDTGSEISYLRSNFIQGAQPFRRSKDFYPAIGEFDVDLYKTDLEIGRLGFTLETGVLPETLNMLQPSGIDGIIGMDLFRKATVYLGFKSNKYWISKR